MSSFRSMLLPSVFAIGMAMASVPTSGDSGPTLAREDTLSTQVAEVLVSAPRVTLDEILARVASGEARRESLITDQAFRLTLRVLSNTLGESPRLEQETVDQVYRKQPRLVRVVRLREWERKPDARHGGEIRVSAGMGEEIVNFAFRPESRREYRYRIEGRDLVGGHLIYRIAFEPKSRLDPTTPSGQVWIDTNEFVILHQEVRFDRSPMPLILKGIDRLVVERQRVDDTWVLKRVLMRAQSTIPLPQLGRAFDFAILYDDYRINSGLDDSLFVTGLHSRGASVKVGNR